MNPRALFSGPSRLRLPSSLPLFPSSPLPQRRFLTFPHPDLDPSKGSTRLVIRAFNGVPSLIHAYAIIRAVSSKLGTSVLEMKIPKDPDTLKHGPTIFLTTLRPVKLDNPLLLEIPAPTISSESNFLGGSSLTDIEAVLSSSPPVASTEITESPEGKNQPIQFRVELQRKAARSDQRAPKRTKYRGPGKEGMEIIRELQNFGDGFFGGFEGLAAKFEHHLERPTEKTRSELASKAQFQQKASEPITLGDTVNSESTSPPPQSSQSS